MSALTLKLSLSPYLRLACQSSGCLLRVFSTVSTPLRVTCGPTASCSGKSSLWVTFPERAVLFPMFDIGP